MKKILAIFLCLTMCFGFIGCSNITKAMMRCIIDSKFIDVKDIYATNKDKYELFKESHKIRWNRNYLRR